MRDFKVYQASRYLTKLVTDASDVRKEYEEISGSLVQFDTPISAPLESLIVDIKPVQSGTGDPSPDNVRPITGWTGANIYHSGEDTDNPTVYTVSWQDEAGTVYGGTVDLVSGELSINKKILAFNSLTWTRDQQYSRFLSNAVPDIVKGKPARTIPSICSAFPVISDGRSIGEVPDNSVYWADTITSSQLCVKTSAWTTPSDFLNDMGNETIVYPINTPITIQLTPQEINTLIGVNNIWADTGDVSVKYRTH